MRALPERLAVYLQLPLYDIAGFYTGMGGAPDAFLGRCALFLKTGRFHTSLLVGAGNTQSEIASHHRISKTEPAANRGSIAYVNQPNISPDDQAALDARLAIAGAAGAHVEILEDDVCNIQRLFVSAARTLLPEVESTEEQT